MSNLVRKGKSEKDNELIESTLNCDKKMKLEKVELENGISYTGEWQNAMKYGEGMQIWADSEYTG
jgi:hypothetical protein